MKHFPKPTSVPSEVCGNHYFYSKIASFNKFYVLNNSKIKKVKSNPRFFLKLIGISRIVFSFIEGHSGMNHTVHTGGMKEFDRQLTIAKKNLKTHV
jgi:hypothetical protein